MDDSRDQSQEFIAITALPGEQKESVRRLMSEHAVAGLEAYARCSACVLRGWLRIPVVDVHPAGVRTECRRFECIDGVARTSSGAVHHQSRLCGVLGEGLGGQRSVHDRRRGITGAEMRQHVRGTLDAIQTLEPAVPGEGVQSLFGSPLYRALEVAMDTLPPVAVLV